MVITWSIHPYSSRQYLLILGLAVWFIGGITEWAFATGSPQPQYDKNKSVSPLSDQERWKNTGSQHSHDLANDTPQVMPFTKPTEITIAQHGGSGVKESPSSAGPAVVGRVIYRGSVPSPMQVEVTRDSDVCGQVVTVASLTTDPMTHGVRDAVVHIESGIEAAEDGLAQSSMVQNKHCVFHPHVAAVRSGTQAEITNDDPIMHNTNITLDSRTVLNVALVAGGNPIQKPLKRGGLHLVTCNIHKFMHAYRYVFNHPFFSQTNEMGQFRIMGLSPGQHTVSVWHETLGILHKEIRLPTHGTMTVDFEFP